MSTVDIRVPDIGDFENVPIIEVHVAPGAEIKTEDPVITLASDKATMDVPAPAAGTVQAVHAKVGDRVSEGSLIATLETAESKAAVATEAAGPSAPIDIPAAKSGRDRKAELHAEILVLGAGPGGYTAAFRAADLGKKVVLVERWPTLGGVCLNVGCIPSKALLHAAKVIDEAHDMAANGMAFGPPKTDIVKLKGWKNGVVKRLTSGLAGLARQRKVTVVQGTGQFISPSEVEVQVNGGG